MPRLPARWRTRLTRTPGIGELVRAGDAANQRQAWQEAAPLYRAALDADPSLAPIWVQYGHALKEQGRLDDAEAAYRNALARDTAQADTHLQLGHVLKLQGRADAAADAYLMAHRCAPALPFARIELEALGVPPPPPRRPGGATLAPKSPRGASHRAAKRPVAAGPGAGPYDRGAAQMLETQGLSANILKIFDYRYYFYANPAVAAALGKPDPQRCLLHFCEQGVDAVLTCGEGLRFEADFYNDAYLGQALSPANAYWHWLCVGYARGWHPNRDAWVRDKLDAPWVSLDGLDVAACREFFYPDDADARWTELFARFLDADVLKPGPHLPVIAASADLFTAIADRFAEAGKDTDGGEDADAGILYQRVLLANPLHRRALAHYAEGALRRGLFSDAVRLYETMIEHGIVTPECLVNAARCYEELGDFRKALETLHSGLQRLPDDGVLATRLAEAGDRFFESEWRIAMAVGKTGRYGDAQQRMAETCGTLVSLFAVTDRLAPAALRSVALVANLGMPQCTFYRVDQKVEHLRAAGYDVEVYDFARDLATFAADIRRHQAVIFYRIPATYPVVAAINRAKHFGLVTFYDIDDFIFGGDDYPGTFESFLDQITIGEYVGLKLMVPVYRHAIALCDYGLASTPALAAEMATLVATGQAFVHRNALSGKQEKLAAEPPAERSGDRVTIFYGSGTKSHKEDFRELVEPALVEIVKRHGDKVSIVLMGHIVLSAELAAMTRNVTVIEPIWDVDHYWAILKSADIAIAVLKHSPMTECKSEIKWLEAAMFGIPSVVSGTVTFREVVEPGVTGLVCDTAAEWTEALDRLVRDEALRRRIGRAARQRVRDAYGRRAMSANLATILAQTTPAATAATRPKIVIVNVFYPPQAVGGATRIVHDNVSHLREEYGDAVDFEVFTTDWGAERDYDLRSYVHEGVRVTVMSRPRSEEVEQSLSDARIEELFGAYLDEVAPALVHFHCIQRLTASVISATAARRIPYLITVHDGWWISTAHFLVGRDGRIDLYDYGAPTGANAALDGDAYRRVARLREPLFGAAKILAVSEKFAELYRRCGVPNVIAIENGIADIAPMPRTRAADGRVRLALISGFTPEKGAELIRYALLSRPFRHLRLSIVDSGLSPGDERHEVWNTTPVDFIAKVPEHRIAELYAGIDVVLAPSVCIESFGLVTREALHCGCWVVASDRGSLGDCVSDGENGHVIDVSDPLPLADVLALIDAAPQRYREPPPVRPVLRRSREQAHDLARLYRSLLAAKGGDAAAAGGGGCERTAASR